MLAAEVHRSGLRLLGDGMVVGLRTAPAAWVAVRRICGRWLVFGMTLRVVRRGCGSRVAVVVLGVEMVVRVVG